MTKKKTTRVTARRRRKHAADQPARRATKPRQPQRGTDQADEAHDGRLEVTSAGPGQGTMATVELGTIAAPPIEERQPSAPSPRPAKPAVVLLVEDDADSAQMLLTLLSLEGFDVRVAASLGEARALAGGCDVLVSDIALPDGSGLELIRELRSSRRIPAIALSGYGGGDVVRRSLEAGFAEHLTKPVDFDRLIGALRRLMEDRGTAAPGTPGSGR